MLCIRKYIIPKKISFYSSVLLAAYQQEPVLSGKTCSCCSCPSAVEEQLLQVTHRAWGRGWSSESKWALAFCCREELYSTLPQAAQKEEFSRWLKQGDIPEESCHLPSFQANSHLLLAPLRTQSPWKERERKAECSNLLLWEGNASALLLSPVSLLVHRIWGQI